MSPQAKKTKTKPVQVSWRLDPDLVEAINKIANVYDDSGVRAASNLLTMASCGWHPLYHYTPLRILHSNRPDESFIRLCGRVRLEVSDILNERFPNKDDHHSKSELRILLEMVAHEQVEFLDPTAFVPDDSQPKFVAKRGRKREPQDA